jgi:hypothetical protein
MTLRPPDRALELVLVLSQQMRDHAAANEWDRVQCLQRERETAIHACFSSQLRLADPAQAAHVIQQVLDLDEEMMAFGISARRRIASELTQVQQGRIASLAYQRCCG